MTNHRTGTHLRPLGLGILAATLASSAGSAFAASNPDAAILRVACGIRGASHPEDLTRCPDIREPRSPAPVTSAATPAEHVVVELYSSSALYYAEEDPPMVVDRSTGDQGMITMLVTGNGTTFEGWYLDPATSFLNLPDLSVKIWDVDPRTLARKLLLDQFYSPEASCLWSVHSGDTAALQAAIDAEKARALAAESALSQAIAAETAARTAADATETAARTAADAAEKSRATAAEAALQQAIDGEVTARQGAVSAEAASRQAADAAEATARQAAVSAEAGARQAADAAEGNARAAGDATTLAQANAYTNTQIANQPWTPRPCSPSPYPTVAVSAELCIETTGDVGKHFVAENVCRLRNGHLCRTSEYCQAAQAGVTSFAGESWSADPSGNIVDYYNTFVNCTLNGLQNNNAQLPFRCCFNR